MPDLRWELWFDGADDLWPAVQRDLLAAFPAELVRQVMGLQRDSEDNRDDAVSAGAQQLAEEWRSSRHRAYDSRAVPPEEADALASATIRAAVATDTLGLAEPLDVVEQGKTLGDLVDAGFGGGSADVLARLVNQGATNVLKWEEALREADPSQARLAAGLWAGAMDRRARRHQFALFGKEWGDRALIVAALLTALAGGGSRGP
jgi:hypothetical protein